MRKLLALVAILFFSCKGSQTSPEKLSIEKGNVDKVQHSNFQELIDTSNLIGSILIYDLQNDVYHSNNFDWAEKGHLPASTFKITNTLIGLETGVIANDSMVFEWDGQDRWSSAWETDLLLRDAFHLSCVPCYQEVARDIGVERMKDYTSKFNYGNIVLDETSIDNFWLLGLSRISQMQQISFLTRLYQKKLPISNETDQIIKSLMIIDSTDQCILSGKTGLSNENDHYNGWFVGFIEREEQALFFATNIEPKDQQIRAGFTNKRKEITILALNSLGFF